MCIIDNVKIEAEAHLAIPAGYVGLPIRIEVKDRPRAAHDTA